MQILLIILAIFFLHGCTPKRVYSQEELSWRLDMIKRGMNPDTGETLAETEQRKAQSAVNFQREMSNLSLNLRQQQANIEAASRGSSVAEDRVRAERNARYAAIVADRPNNSDSVALRRAKESDRKVEVAKQKEALVETKRKREQTAQARSKEESTAKEAEQIGEERIKNQQKSADLKVQKENDRKRAEAEEKSKTERDRLNRERAAVAEATLKKAEREKNVHDEKISRANYLSQLERGIKLAALTYPGGEGKHYIVGIRPKIKPEVVSCIDVSYVATCNGARQAIPGIAKNFIGVGTDCFFGDAAEISPTPACKVKDVKVTITKVKACGE